MARHQLDRNQQVKDDTRVAAVFEVKLPAGPARGQGWFYDKQGKALLGAYYLSVERK